ncbi:MAG TPA: AsmA family protein [Acidobacteriaceae bacterium]|nr:AsmA family protein [Acidobacteriaceae bacterium]
MKKTWIRILVAVAALIVIVVLIVPLFVNANTFRPLLESELSQALGRPVTLGNLSFSLFTGSLVADNLSIGDDPAFSKEPFFQAKSLHIGIETGPLLFHRQLIVRSFAADSPSIHLIHSPNGTWNFSSIGRGAASAKQNQQQSSAIPNLTIGQIKIENGQAAVSSQPPSGQPLVYSNLNLSASQVSFSKNFPFQLTADLPGGGSLALNGNAGPLNQQDASSTPFSANISFKHFDPVATGVVDPQEGIAMVADISAQLTSDGQTLASSGKVKADHLQVVRGGSPTPKPVDIDYTIHHNLQARTGNVDHLQMTTGGVAVQVTGNYQLAAPKTTLDLHLSAPKLPVDQVQSLLPVAGVHLPKGSMLQGGTLNADLKINGPADALVISGPVEIDNTRLAGFDLGSRIGGLKAAGSSPQGTPIQVLRANLNNSPAGTRIDNLYVEVPTLGTAAGNGTVSPAGGLDFRVVAKFNTSSGVASQVLGGLSAVSSVLGKAVGNVAASGIPVTITGTSTDPVIQADLSKVLKQGAGSLLQQQLGNSNQQTSPANILNKLFPR